MLQQPCELDRPGEFPSRCWQQSLIRTTPCPPHTGRQLWCNSTRCSVQFVQLISFSQDQLIHFLFTAIYCCSHPSILFNHLLVILQHHMIHLLLILRHMIHLLHILQRHMIHMYFIRYWLFILLYKLIYGHNHTVPIPL